MGARVAIGGCRRCGGDLVRGLMAAAGPACWQCLQCGHCPCHPALPPAQWQRRMAQAAAAAPDLAVVAARALQRMAAGDAIADPQLLADALGRRVAEAGAPPGQPAG